jgi:hypothetical protein
VEGVFSDIRIARFYTADCLMYSVEGHNSSYIRHCKHLPLF